MTILPAITALDLSTVTGGASSKGSALVLDKLNDRFGGDGAVSFVGRPKSVAAGGGVRHLTGKFDVNALSGGTTHRSFSANADLGHHAVSNLHTRVIGFE